MSNIYDTANQIERELRELDEFKALQAAYEEVKADEAAYTLFKEFQGFQQGLQEKQRNSSYQRINAKRTSV